MWFVMYGISYLQHRKSKEKGITYSILYFGASCIVNIFCATNDTFVVKQHIQ